WWISASLTVFYSKKITSRFHIFNTKGQSASAKSKTARRAFERCSVVSYMKRELKPEEHEEIVRAVAAGDRIKATNIYLSATEGSLTDAQNYVKRLTAEAEAAESERS